MSNLNNEYLPIKLIDKIENDIFNNSLYNDYRTKNNFLICVALIYHHQKESLHTDNYVPLGRSYWHGIFGGNYKDRVINPLKDMGIIQEHNFGFKKGAVGVRYRITPTLITYEHRSIEYLNPKNEDLKTTAEIIYDDKLTEYRWTNKNKPFISINATKVNKWIDENAKKIFYENLSYDYVNVFSDNYNSKYYEIVDITNNKETYQTLKKKYGSIKNIKLNASENNNTLLFYKNDLYSLNDITSFEKKSIEALKHNYHYNVSLIKSQKQLVETRSNKTLRIYSHLANFPSKLLPFLYINGKTSVQIDLRTSQVLLLANILNVYLMHGETKLLSIFKTAKTKKLLNRLISIIDKHEPLLPSGIDITSKHNIYTSTNDIKSFIVDVFYHDFYDILKSKLGLSSRTLSKQIVFQLLFKLSPNTNPLIEKFKEEYPLILSIINDYKRKPTKGSFNEDDYNFSILLQRVEAEIIIDKILYPLRENGIPVFSRHDSILVPEIFGDKALNHIKSVFDEINFKLNYKYEEMFWEISTQDELDDYGYSDWYDGEQLLTDKTLIVYNTKTAKTTPVHLLKEIEQNPMNDLEEYEQEIIYELLSIGIQDDYVEHIDIDLLSMITHLPFLSTEQINNINEDIMNIQYGMSFFQDETNETIRNIIRRFF